MEEDSVINLLLVQDDIDEANRMVSLLRNANFNVEPHYAASAAELSKKLQERNWELALVEHQGESVPAKTVLHQIRRLNKDIPVIFTMPEFNPALIVDALKMGADDAVMPDEDQYFIQVVTRTLHHLEQRRRLRYWKRRFSESEDRFESLILSSRDGIAIIQEGAYVHVNSAYAQFFGYMDQDSLTLLPVFDTLSDDSQTQFKKYLKPLDPQDAWDTEIIFFQGARPDGSTMPVQATLSQIDFHGEPALQLMVKYEHMGHSDEPSHSGSSSMPVVDVDVGKIRLQEIVESINSTLRRAAKTGEDALLYYIEIDQYETLQQQFGIGKTEEGVTHLANFLDGLLPEKTLFGRIREEAFVLIIGSSDTEKGLALGRRLVREASAQIFATSDGSFTCTLSIGLSPIGEATASADEGLSACLKAIAELQKPDAQGKVGNDVKLYEPTLTVSAEGMSETDILRIGKQLIKKKLINLAFQPIISLHGLEDEYYEVLMRINTGGITEETVPENFIVQIFKSELAGELDRLMIAMALRNLAEKKTSAPQTKLFLHISLASIRDEKFIPWLQRELETTHLKPADLCFQMREFDIGSHLGQASNLLQRLHNIGSSTCLAHFGLAINPMMLLNKIEVGYIKLDGAIVAKALKEKASISTLTDLISQLKEAQHRVIVPNIESATIIPTLWQTNTDFLQGNYIQPPSPEMNFDFTQD